MINVKQHVSHDSNGHSPNSLGIAETPTFWPTGSKPSTTAGSKLEVTQSIMEMIELDGLMAKRGVFFKLGYLISLFSGGPV